MPVQWNEPLSLLQVMNGIRHLLVIIFDKAKKRLVIECKKYLTKQNKEIKKMRDIISCGIV
jgi:hypothetical protein